MKHTITTAICSRPKFLKRSLWRHVGGHCSAELYHQADELTEDPLPPEWYRAAYARLVRLAHSLRNVKRINGRLIHMSDGSVIVDDYAVRQMEAFTSLGKSYVQKKGAKPGSCFSKPTEGKSMRLDSLTKVCNLLGISAQQRKTVRLTVCPQVTQHHIWRGALEAVLEDLKHETGSPNFPSRAFSMGEQIVSTCSSFLRDTASLGTSSSPPWMRPAPLHKAEQPLVSRKWEEVLEMFMHLSKCLGQDEGLACQAAKLEAMKEGLYQIKDILVERDIGYKEARRQDCLVQKKLSKSLGHSSKCLFTLLMYYLFGTVRDIDMEVWGDLHGNGKRFAMWIGKILASDEERMVWSGVKEMSRALGVMQFVWETAGASGVLELQAHLWCVGAEERALNYRGHVFYVHAIRL